jgi:hypothetical protein
MVKINISIEGDNIEDIVSELLSIGKHLYDHNRKEIKELMHMLSDDAFDVLMERKTLERGAQLYKKINSEINWTYKRDKS